MKKALIIVTAVVLLAVLAVVVTVVFMGRDTGKDIVNSPAPISLQLRDQLDADFSGCFQDTYAPNWYSEDNIYGYCKIYGSENGYYLFFFTGGMRPAVEVTVNIGGVEFYNPMPFNFYAYKDGNFIEIEDAFEQGLISSETLIKAQEYHKQCLEEFERN